MGQIKEISADNRIISNREGRVTGVIAYIIFA